MAYQYAKMELRSLISFGIVTLLAGCIAQPAQPKRNDISESAVPFIIDIPIAASHKYVRASKSIAYATYEAPTSDYQTSDYLIEVYPPESLSSPCSPSLTGASEMIPVSGENGPPASADSERASKTVWGKVDYWDRFNSEHGVGGGIDERVVCTNYGIPIYPAIYGLCAEKDGKTVVICINQMTDDKEMAQKIFETFRWLP